MWSAMSENYVVTYASLKPFFRTAVRDKWLATASSQGHKLENGRVAFQPERLESGVSDPVEIKSI